MAKTIEGLKTAPAGNHADGMVFKVQISLASSDNKRHLLIYNKGKSILYQQELTKELEKSLGTEIKAFWFGYVSAEKRIVLTSKAPMQDW